MKLRYNLQVFVKELLLFSGTMALGMYSAYQHRPIGGSVVSGAVQPLEFTQQDIITLVLFFVVFSVILVRWRHVAGVLLKVFFMIVIFSGSQVVFESFLPFPNGLILSLLVLVSMIGGSTILIHNLAVLLGIAGLSSLLGLSITPTSGAILLAVLSIYDVIAVYKTRHMVAMAENMIQSGAIFGFLIPFRWSGFSLKTREAKPGQQVMILGSGDIGLPVVFVSSLIPVSVAGAVFVALFSMLGLFATHLLFTNQSERRPMAALPPIAAATILGYLLWVVL